MAKREIICTECERRIVPGQECAHDEIGQAVGAVKFQQRPDVDKKTGFSEAMMRNMGEDEEW
jgi:hypothetical protein